MHVKTGLALRLQFARRLVDASGDGESQLVELLGTDDVQVVGQLVAVLVMQVVVSAITLSTIWAMPRLDSSALMRPPP